MAREARQFVDEAVLVRIFSSNLDKRTTGKASPYLICNKISKKNALLLSLSRALLPSFRPCLACGSTCPVVQIARKNTHQNGYFRKYLKKYEKIENLASFMLERPTLVDFNNS